jgi:hypothetical protein
MSPPKAPVYLILNNGNPTDVHHNHRCRCMREHGPYRLAWSTEGKRPCGYCGGGR